MQHYNRKIAGIESWNVQVVQFIRNSTAHWDHGKVLLPEVRSSEAEAWVAGAGPTLTPTLLYTLLLYIWFDAVLYRYGSGLTVVVDF